MPSPTRPWRRTWPLHPEQTQPIPERCRLAAPRRCRTDRRRASCLIPVHGIPEYLACLEHRHRSLRYLQGLAGARIASAPGHPPLRREPPEAHNCHVLALRDRFADHLEHRIHREQRGQLAQARSTCHASGNLSSIHAIPSPANLDGVGKTTLVNALAEHYKGEAANTPGPFLPRLTAPILDALGDNQTARCLFYAASVLSEGRRARKAADTLRQIPGTRALSARHRHHRRLRCGPRYSGGSVSTIP